MDFNRFGLLLGARLALLLLSIGVTGFLLVAVGYPTAALISLAVSVLLTVDVVRFVSKTNQELTRFLDAARYADFSQRFEFSSMGGGFQQLGETFTDILTRFRANRAAQESELRHLKAILEHVPVPLISVHVDDSVSLWNNAARRLFGRYQIDRVQDLHVFGAQLPGEIRKIQPGQRALVSMEMDNLRQSITLSASDIVTGSNTERIISLQNIQSELDGMQLQAWQDLVRVLTHEIMNSVTPVSSLARTAADLVDDVSGKVASNRELVAELADIRAAVDTVARRSDGLMDFVDSYRRLLRLPEPDRSTFSVRDLLADVARIAAVNWSALGITLKQSCEPNGLELDADRKMLEQVLINLLMNAEQALTDGNSSVDANRRVDLLAKLNPAGRICIEVADNGPGIPEDVAARMFVPFYTTRKQGSGVGLALSRQIMNVHGGSISFRNVASTQVPAGQVSGARFTLTF